MIADLDFLDNCAQLDHFQFNRVQGGTSAQATTVVGVSPTVAVAGAQATAQGANRATVAGTFVTVVGLPALGSAHATAWATGYAQSGSNYEYSSSSSSGYASGGMSILVTNATQAKS
jgi:hypothetical protein